MLRKLSDAGADTIVENLLSDGNIDSDPEQNISDEGVEGMFTNILHYTGKDNVINDRNNNA